MFFENSNLLKDIRVKMVHSVSGFQEEKVLQEHEENNRLIVCFSKQL